VAITKKSGSEDPVFQLYFDTSFHDFVVFSTEHTLPVMQQYSQPVVQSPRTGFQHRLLFLPAKAGFDVSKPPPQYPKHPFSVLAKKIRSDPPPDLAVRAFFEA
jgi:hypothetical protein